MATRILLICSLPAERPVFPGDRPASARALARIGRIGVKGAPLTSPLLRARQTAAALGLAADPAPALAEADCGRWAGRTPEAVLAEDPAGFAQWHGDPHAAPHGGESFATMAARLADWLEAQRTGARDLVAVTHPGPIQAALIHVLAAPLSAARAIGVRPLSRTCLSHDGRRWSLLIEP